MSDWRSRRREEYAAKLKDPKWQKRRLEIFERDKWECADCGDKETTLNVHHRWYESGKEPWEAVDECLVTLCETCHENESNNRRDEEQHLLDSLKRRYWSYELFQIAKIFKHMPHRHVTEVQLTAVAWFLSDDLRVDAVLREYFDRRCPQPGEGRGK